ncbi:CotH kinase family protein [Paenibacillus sp. FA6]|uniref:CotH kinase family protein n=1 Tax=Paenibacillus sp. FA6 TaxID=3413029 RepID=UPI003F657CCF
MTTKTLKLVLCICSISIMIAMVGCEAAVPTTSIEDSGISSTAKTSEVDEDRATKVFPKDKVIDVKITLDEEDFQSMLDNASAEEMMTASVDYNGVHLDNVGIRTKGNLSLRSVVSMTDSDRYSFKLSFDEYLSSQTLFGISKINLNNNYSDASYMREYLTYELAEEMGLPTPGYSFVNIYVNDTLWGFYLAVQQVDEQYLESNFGNSYGALYKGQMTGTGSDLVWIDNKITSYTGLALKSESSNKDILIDMLDELNNGTDYEKVLNVDDALGYIALNVLTNNTDSYIGGLKQNYYLYEDKGIFSILPWDYNMAFGGLGSSNLLIDEPTQGALAERPLVAKLLAIDVYKDNYHEILQKATEGYLSTPAFSERVEELSALISSYVEKDPSSFYTYDEYQSGVTKLKTINDSQVSNISQQLAGTIASSGDGSGSGGGMGGGMGGGGRGGNGGGRDMPAMAGNNEQAIPTELNAQVGQVAPTDKQANQGDQAATDGQNTNAQGGFPGMGGELPEGMEGFPDMGGKLPEGMEGFPDMGGELPEGMEGFPDMGGKLPEGMEGFPDMGGELPEGMEGFLGGMGGNRPNGIGDFGGFGEQNTQPQGTVKEALTAGIALVVLLLSGLFITFYKRKRL